MPTPSRAKITLTSISVDIYPVRTITISSGHPVQVGRASSNVARNLLPQENNTIYEAPVISRAHASIFMDQDNKVYIKDMNSSHGTYVNGQAIKEPVILHAGDNIVLGADIRHRNHGATFPRLPDDIIGLARSHSIQVSSLDYLPLGPNSFGIDDELLAYDTHSELQGPSKSCSSSPSFKSCIEERTLDDLSLKQVPSLSDVVYGLSPSLLIDGDSTESEYEEPEQDKKSAQQETSGTPHTSPVSVAPDSMHTKTSEMVGATRTQDIQNAIAIPSVQSLLSFDNILAKPNEEISLHSTPISDGTSPIFCPTTSENAQHNIDLNDSLNNQSPSPSRYVGFVETQQKDYLLKDSDLQECNDILPFEPIPLGLQCGNRARTSSLTWKSRVGSRLGKASIASVQRSNKQFPVSQCSIFDKSSSPFPKFDLLHRSGLVRLMDKSQQTQISLVSLIEKELLSWQVFVDLASLLFDSNCSDSHSHEQLISKAFAYWESRDIQLRSDKDVPLKMLLKKHWDLLLSTLKSHELKIEDALAARDEITFGENIRLPDIIFEMSIGQYLDDDALIEKSLNQLCSWEGIACQSIYEKRVIPFLTSICTSSNGGIAAIAVLYMRHYETAIAPKFTKDRQGQLVHVPRVQQFPDNINPTVENDSKKRKRQFDQSDAEVSLDTTDVSTATEELETKEPAMKKQNVGGYIWTGVAGVLVGGIGTIAVLIASASDTNV